MTQGDAQKRRARPAIQRVLDRIVVDASGCWIWQGAKTGYGHGMIGVGSRTDGTRRLQGCHVVTWESQHGPVPAGLELDHLCRVPACCNPAHLEAVTHAVNLQRMTPQAKAVAASNLAVARQSRW